MTKFLKTISTTLPLCLSALLASANAQPDSLVLSLDKCISIALNENPTIKVADMEIERVDYSKKETIGQLLPSISFGATYNRTLAKQTMYMNMGRSQSTQGEDGKESSQQSSSSSNSGIKVGLDNSFSMGFQASLPLIAPQLWKTLALSDSCILETVEQARTSRLKLVNEVQNAYYTLLLALDSHKVINESYDMAKFTADLYGKQYELGAASQYDVLRTQVAVKNIEPELTQAQIAVKRAQLQLTILLGINQDIKLVPNTTLSHYENSMYGNVMAIDTSTVNNPDLRMLDIQTRQLDNALTIQKMAWYPTLALTANYNWTSMSNGSPFKNFRWNPYSMVGLTLSIPLFEGGQRYSRIKQARIQLDEMKWQRENLERSVRMQTDLAMENIHLNVQQIASSSESMKQAEKAHDIVKQSFEIGAASYLDLRDS
ncbi:MAG: TolC family protein [Paramuribaculum sp.]|nr:TolC family protein [Paramuribaculum sp.]